MPYVEGFGTYPFGEEWLFDAVVRSYLPVLEVARDLTMTVTPVLADQLEDAGRGGAAAALPGRLPDRLRGSRPARHRAGAAARLRGGARPLPARAGAARRGGRRSAGAVPAGGGGGAGGARRLLGDPRAAAAAGDAGRAAAAARRRDPLAPPPLRLGRRLLAARVRLRRRGSSGGWPSAGSSGSASTRAPTRSRSRRCARWRPRPGPVALPIDWEAISWLWALDGYPSDPAYAQFDGKSLRGIRLWKIGGGAYDPEAGAAAARRQAGEFLAAIAARLRDYAAERGRRGLIVFAIDTELLGHWWSEGPLWLAAVLDGRRRGRGAAGDRPAGARRPRAASAGRCAAPAGARTRTSRPGTRRRSPTSPGRRGGWSCACCGRCAAGLRGAARRAGGARAARRPGQRLGLPRPPRPGRRLRLAAGHRSLARRSTRP